MSTPEGLARAHGLFNIVGGAWPLVHRRSFEGFFGPKQEEWLQQTTGALLVAAGCSQVLTVGEPGGHAHARRTGLGTAATLLAIDLIYAPRGRIRWTYLLDGALEAAWIVAWLRMGRKARQAAVAERRAAMRTPVVETPSAPASPGTVTAEHVEQLLNTDDPGAALVAVGGRIEVVSSAESSGGLVVAEREEVLRTLPAGDRSRTALQQVARALDTAVSDLGG
ncbi:hypothetical protein ABGB12_30525 [Actinocorallia sp. B10E7]|uniref:hypothetical protein n=1 Tax=Actinocorallia sp. B10E7 TaxID=3153558 RepID=UPI00325D184A